MPSPLIVEYQDRDWVLDPSAVTSRELIEVERLTGLPGMAFLETLRPTLRDGSQLKTRTDADGNVEVVGVDDPSELRLNVPTAVLVGLWWLLQRHAGTNPGSIDNVEIAYQPFLIGVVKGMFKMHQANLQVTEADPKGQSGSVSITSTTSSASVNGPDAPSFS